MIFPAPAGVFPTKTKCMACAQLLPCMDGGVSPHDTMKAKVVFIFPAGVGVFLMNRWSTCKASNLPRTRGGVSQVSFGELGALEIFPAPAGGVSFLSCLCGSPRGASPQVRGCMAQPVGEWSLGKAFRTCRCGCCPAVPIFLANTGVRRSHLTAGTQLVGGAD